jgi:hypothetical protein
MDHQPPGSRDRGSPANDLTLSKGEASVSNGAGGLAAVGAITLTNCSVEDCLCHIKKDADAKFY